MGVEDTMGFCVCCGDMIKDDQYHLFYDGIEEICICMSCIREPNIFKYIKSEDESLR